MPRQPPITDPCLQADITGAFEPDVLADLLSQFRSAIGAEADAVRRAEATGDRDEAIQAAHRLASAASQFGFPELALAARAVEAGQADSRGADLYGALERAQEAARRLTPQRRPKAAR